MQTTAPRKSSTQLISYPRKLLLTAALISLAGCASNPAAPPPPESTGAAGGGASVGADATLQTCSAPVGTVRLQDGNSSADTGANQVASNENVQSLRLLLKDLKDLTGKDKKEEDRAASIEALRLLIQQSGCFVIVDRGASENAATDEKNRSRSPGAEVRDNANMGKGQEVAADFVLRSVVLSMEKDESSSINVGGLIPFKALGGLSVGQSSTSAKVQLVLSDVRAKIQLAIAQGAATGKNTGIATSVLGKLGGGQIKTGSTTSSSTILLQAFADAYNKLVPAVQNYKAQEVKGGLGAGGALRVQGRQLDPSSVSKK